MSRIAMESQGKRPRFFPESGTDETVSMLLELMSELWVVRERLHALEKIAAEQGLELTPGIESWKPNDEEAAALDAERQRFIQTAMRSLDANHVPGLHLRRALDEAARQKDDGTLLTDAAQAA